MLSMAPKNYKNYVAFVITIKKMKILLLLIFKINKILSQNSSELKITKMSLLISKLIKCRLQNCINLTFVHLLI